MTTGRKIFLLSVLALFATWLVFHAAEMTGGMGGTFRPAAALFFAALVVVRPKPRLERKTAPQSLMAAMAVAGAMLCLSGAMLSLPCLEWIGILGLLCASLLWALPEAYSRDTVLSLLPLCLAHPMPAWISAPLESAMQRLSVDGAEWLLHCFNVNAWTSSPSILTTGLRTFEVPISYGGASALAPALVCALGSGLLLRFGWGRIAGLAVIGLVQALSLNIARIAVMALLAPRMRAEWAPAFLGNSQGVFLFASVVLLLVEAFLWRLHGTMGETVRRAVADGIAETGDVRHGFLPVSWRFLAERGRLCLTVLVFAGLAAFARSRRTPYHRSEMISGVFETLAAAGAPASESAAREVLRLNPANHEVRTEMARVLMSGGRHEQALTELAKIPLRQWGTAQTTLNAWGLMETGRIGEGIALIEGLPADDRNQPDVAMLRAELAARKNEPSEAARHAVRAAERPLLADRIRALYPYLAAHEQWSAIAQADFRLGDERPCAVIEHAILAIEAHVRMSDFAAASETLDRAMRNWPDDPRFLRCLAAIALKRPEMKCAQKYSHALAFHLNRLDADALASAIETGFRMTRPDLAWIACARLAALDPADPSLLLAPAQFGEKWFVFQRHAIGIRAAHAGEHIDLRPLCMATVNLPMAAQLWRNLPLTGETGAGGSRRKGDACARLCLKELERRESAGSLSVRMKLACPVALEILGNHDEAHNKLRSIAQSHPDLRSRLLLHEAALYAGQSRWQDCYEALKEFSRHAREPSLVASTLLINALLRLDMGMYAMSAAEETLRTFPGSAQGFAAMAAVWDAFGFKDQALFLLERAKGSYDERAMARLLRETGHYAAAQRMARSCGIPEFERFPQLKQAPVPPPAELCVAPQWEPIASDAEYSRRTLSLGNEIPAAVSPFIRNLKSRQLEWWRGRGADEAAAADKWMSVGRDPQEQAAALNELARLLARQKKHKEASAVTARALEILPLSSVLHRAQIALSGGRKEAVDRALSACPGDPEIWLAYLVARTRSEGAGEWAGAEIEKAAASRTFPPATMVRAGDFLWRHGMREAAASAARCAISRGDDMFQAGVLGLKCALSTGDRQWALTCATRAAEQAPDSAPFDRVVADLRMFEKLVEADLLAPLDRLVAALPGPTQAAVTPGDPYFVRADTRSSFDIFERLVDDDDVRLSLDVRE